jgi:hypothetical protein
VALIVALSPAPENAPPKEAPEDISSSKALRKKS